VYQLYESLKLYVYAGMIIINTFEKNVIMPLVKIELLQGRDKEILIQIQIIVMDCLIDCLGLPNDDRNIRLLEYPDYAFSMKKPYEIIIEISMFSGRTNETKKKVFQTIVNRLQDSLNIPKETIFILLNTQPQENWGVRGGIPANEVNLDFKVNI
jgi:phenylpyruvate tautomerase PptA (4-oxalocrotonate tautomerase family)